MMCNEIGCVVVGHYEPTNDEPSKTDPTKEVVVGRILPHLNGDVENGLTL